MSKPPRTWEFVMGEGKEVYETEEVVTGGLTRDLPSELRALQGRESVGVVRVLRRG